MTEFHTPSSSNKNEKNTRATILSRVYLEILSWRALKENETKPATENSVRGLADDAPSEVDAT